MKSRIMKNVYNSVTKLEMMTHVYESTHKIKKSKNVILGTKRESTYMLLYYIVLLDPVYIIQCTTKETILKMEAFTLYKKRTERGCIIRFVEKNS